MAKFLLLLYDNPANWQNISPEEMQQAIAKYMAWGQRLRTKGVLVGSDKLQDGEGRVLRKSAGNIRVSDGPYAESKEIFGGYFAIDVPDYNAAVSECNDCPHLDYGGTIEIRQVHVFPNR
jgi:hypothetical protein